MAPSLKKILNYRYKPILTILFMAIIGIYIFQTISGISSWRSNYTYFNSPQAEIDFNKKIKEGTGELVDPEDGLFLYYNLENDQVIYADTFDKYKDYHLTIFYSNEDANQLAYNAYPYYNENFFILLTIFVITGVMLFLFDLRSQFTATLFSTKYTRSSIYWYKIKLVGGALFLFLLIGKSLSFFAYHFFIPNHYLNISYTQHILSTLSGGITLLALFALSCFIGLLFGEWLYGIGTILALFLTFSMFLSNIDLIYQTFFIDDSKMISTVSTTFLNYILPILQTSLQPMNWSSLICLSLFALLSLLLGRKIFANISLETTGNFILVPKFNRLFQIILIVYGMTISAVPIILTTLLPSEAMSISEILINCFVILASFIAYFLLSEYILYQNKSKIIQKVSFFN